MEHLYTEFIAKINAAERDEELRNVIQEVHRRGFADGREDELRKLDRAGIIVDRS